MAPQQRPRSPRCRVGAPPAAGAGAALLAAGSHEKMLRETRAVGTGEPLWFCACLYRETPETAEQLPVTVLLHVWLESAGSFLSYV